MAKLNSIEARLIVALLLLTILPVIAVGWVAHNMVFENIRSERMKTVGRVADAKHDQLAMVLSRANSRAKLFLSELDGQCSDGAGLNRNCAIKLLGSYLTAEAALGATLHRQDGSLSVGTSAPAQDAAFRPGQLAKFSGIGPGNNQSYFISAAAGGLQLDVSYPSSNLQPIFDRPTELGESGETFLADGEGYFVTRNRYPSTQGLSERIHAHPMHSCLSGENKEVLDLDYRDVDIIHGYRRIPEFGSACIMAHIDQSEAFAPLVALQQKLVITAAVFLGLLFLVAIVMARSIAKPIAGLTRVARRIASGDHQAQAEVAGNDEISELASSFNSMTGQLVSVNSQLEHKVLELAESYRKLQQLSLYLDNVKEGEQERIARELHDEMGATLTALKMSVHWLASKLPAETTQFEAGWIIWASWYPAPSIPCAMSSAN